MAFLCNFLNKSERLDFNLFYAKFKIGWNLVAENNDVYVLITKVKELDIKNTYKIKLIIYIRSGLLGQVNTTAIGKFNHALQQHCSIKKEIIEDLIWLGRLHGKLHNKHTLRGREREREKFILQKFIPQDIFDGKKKNGRINTDTKYFKFQKGTWPMPTFKINRAFQNFMNNTYSIYTVQFKHFKLRLSYRIQYMNVICSNRIFIFEIKRKLFLLWWTNRLETIEIAPCAPVNRFTYIHIYIYFFSFH